MNTFLTLLTALSVIAVGTVIAVGCIVLSIVYIVQLMNDILGTKEKAAQRLTRTQTLGYIIKFVVLFYIAFVITFALTQQSAFMPKREMNSTVPVTQPTESVTINKDVPPLRREDNKNVV